MAEVCQQFLHTVATEKAYYTRSAPTPPFSHHCYYTLESLLYHIYICHGFTFDSNKKTFWILKMQTKSLVSHYRSNHRHWINRSIHIEFDDCLYVNDTLHLDSLAFGEFSREFKIVLGCWSLFVTAKYFCPKALSWLFSADICLRLFTTVGQVVAPLTQCQIPNSAVEHWQWSSYISATI